MDGRVVGVGRRVGAVSAWLRHGLLVIFLTTSALGGAGCSRCSSPSTDDGTTPTNEHLPPLVLKDDTPDVLLTWIDEAGEFHVVQHPADVPEKARDAVRVVTPKAGSGASSLLYVADLRKKKSDGSYPVKTMPRSQWESLASKRRKARMEALAPRPSASPSTGSPSSVQHQPSTSVTAIVYGASWCSACRGAERFLRSKGVHVIFKDMDKDSSARAEMKAKLDRAGIRDRGSIPVIDIQGHVLVGFDQAAIERVLRQVSRGDYL